NLDRETGIRAGQRRGYVAQRDRLPDAMTEAAGGDPTYDFSFVPDGLVADRIDIGGVDHDRHALSRRSMESLAFHRAATDEIPLVHADEATEARFIGCV